MLNEYTDTAIALLEKLVSTPSFSKEENLTADIIEQFFEKNNIPSLRIGNNVIVQQEKKSDKPLLILNSHHDTVKPGEGWTVDPFKLTVEGEKLIGLGSNDAGGCLVSLIMCFTHFYNADLPFRLMLIASAEEEISGQCGLSKVLNEMKPQFWGAIVGEPTSRQMAIAEKGLIVIDGLAKGKSGHAAHQYDNNALYNAINDIEIIKNLNFSKISELLGAVKLTVTQITAGKQHNVIPDSCHFVIDCRINEHYSNLEILQTLRELCQSELTPRSTHLNSSQIPMSHPIIISGQKIGLSYYGSPTISDQVFFNGPSLKIGPGDSTRSHQSNEFIYKNELKEGINTYIQLLKGINPHSF